MPEPEPNWVKAQRKEATQFSDFNSGCLAVPFAATILVAPLSVIYEGKWGFGAAVYCFALAMGFVWLAKSRTSSRSFWRYFCVGNSIFFIVGFGLVLLVNFTATTLAVP